MAESPSIEGCLLGIAIGDSLGLPFEGLSRRRAEKRLKGRALSQSLFLGHGMLSDDTEQNCLVLEATLASGDNPTVFQRQLAKRLRKWFLAVPPGVGLATIRACLRLCVGVNPRRSGVQSAGNGAAMRAPILGALLVDQALRGSFVAASSEITHRDSRAIDGARIMADFVAESPRVSAGDLAGVDLVRAQISRCQSDEWQKMLTRISSDLAHLTPEEFAKSIGAGDRVSGYVMTSVAVTVFVWLSAPNQPAEGMERLIRMGGDTDTTAAMLGALYGASLGPGAFPVEWFDRIMEWPRTRSYLRSLATSVATGKPPRRILWIECLGRNVFFLFIVLAHGLRRLVP